MKEKIIKLLKFLMDISIKLLRLLMNFLLKMLIHKPKLTLVMLLILSFFWLQQSQMEVERQSKVIADYDLKQVTVLNEDKSRIVKEIPEDLVKVPNTFFKTKEHVQAMFSHAGLKVEFVPKNFDDAAQINKRNIYVGDSYQLEPQPNLQYLDYDGYGDNYGYYAKKGSTIVVGYTEHDYYYKDEETEKKSASSSSSTSSNASESSSTPSSSTSPIVLDVNDFIKKYNDSELDTTQTYQFDAEPFNVEDWGLDADGKEYGITINDGSHAGFLLLVTESIATSIKNSKTVTFTVKIDTTSTTYIEPIRVVSATPKPGENTSEASSTSKPDENTSEASSTTTPSSENPDLNEYAIFLQDTINAFAEEYQVTVYKKEGGVIHIVFPQDIKYESTAHLQAFSDAMLEAYRSAFYLWSEEKNFNTTNGLTDIPIFYMDAEDGTRIAEYSVLSGKMKVKIKN